MIISLPSGASRAKSGPAFAARTTKLTNLDLLVAGSTHPNAARIMPKVHDMWVNSLAALLGALAAIQSALSAFVQLSLFKLNGGWDSQNQKCDDGYLVPIVGPSRLGVKL